MPISQHARTTFSDQSVVLTGASSGIGREMALLLADAGAKLCLGARRGVPTRSGYAASKHALHGFFDTLRIELRGSVSGKGVGVTIACPDFVATETREHAWGTDGERVGESPVKEGEIMPAVECARRILEGSAKRKRELILSRRGKLGLVLKFFAPSLVDRIAAGAIRRGR